jgi:ATP dependent DNA ligase domain
MSLREHNRTGLGIIAPCLPSPAKAPPSGPGWLHEIKHDGFRIMARRDGAGIRLITRHGNDFTNRFPIIVAAVTALPAQSFLIDGEAIVTNGDGLAVFDLIRHKRQGDAAVLCAFDLVFKFVGLPALQPTPRRYPLQLWLGAAGPIELVIEANDDRVEIGAYADRRNCVEVVVFAAEIVEVVLNLGGEVFDQTEFDAGADGETGTVVGEDLSCSSNRRASGKKILGIPDIHPGAARLAVEQPVIGGIAEPPGQSGKPLGLRREAFLRDGIYSDRARACASD